MVRMDITPYVDSLRRDLVTATETGTDDVRAAAERLTLALGPAARLTLMEALSHAAAEITAELPAGTVDVRLNGRDLDFVVTAPAPAEPAPSAPPTARMEESGEDPDGDKLARITLRIPEPVKTRAEDSAARQGQSLNTWLVAAVRRAVSDDAVEVDLDLSSIPFPDDPFVRGRTGRGRKMTGWI